MPVNADLEIDDPGEATTNASGQYVIAASTLLANDIDYAGNALSIRNLLTDTGSLIGRGQSGVVNGGTAALSSTGTTITFTPTVGFTGLMSFQYNLMGGTVVQLVGTSTTAEMSATVYLNTPSDPTDSMFDSEWFLQAVNVIPAWQDGYNGAGVSVGVFDPSGNVDFGNPDLAPNAGLSVMIDGQPGTQPTGTHATLVAGVIAAAGVGGNVIGIAPDATIDSEAIGTPLNSTVSTDNSNLLDWSNYDVVNNSFGILPRFQVNNLVAPTLADLTPPTVFTALINAVRNGRGGLGTVVVVAGGNGRASGQTTNDFYLTNSPYEITVAGINAPGDLGALQPYQTPFSDPGASILVSVPANNIESTSATFTNDFGQQFGADEQTTQGISFAAPIVSGVVALMLQANPNLTFEDVQQILAYSAVEIAPTDVSPFGTGWLYNTATNWNGGGLHFNADYGFGEVDALAAVRLAETWQTGAQATLPAVLSGTKSNQSLASGTFHDVTVLQTGTPSVDIEDVQVNVDLTNVVLNDLVITLTSPTGVVSTLMYHPGEASSGTSPGNATTDPTDFALTSNFSFTFGTVEDRGELYTDGQWAITVTDDDASGEAAQAALASWSVGVVGTPTTPAQTYVYTNEFGSLSADPNNAPRGTLNNPGAPVTLNAAAVSSGSMIDLHPGSTDSVIAGRGLTIGQTTTATSAFGGDGNDTIIGNNYGDTLSDGGGNNDIIGGLGADTLTAGGGNDTLTGGGGSDAYSLGLDDNVGGGGIGQDVIVNGVSSQTAPTGTLLLGPCFH